MDFKDYDEVDEYYAILLGKAYFKEELSDLEYINWHDENVHFSSFSNPANQFGNHLEFFNKYAFKYNSELIANANNPELFVRLLIAREDAKINKQ